MKKIFILFLYLISFNISKSQSISLFDIDASSFPSIKGKFYAFDESGNQIKPQISEFKLSENGIPRTITNVSCPSPKPPQPISSVLVLDVSGSMAGFINGAVRMDAAKSAATTWVNGLPLGISDCAIVSFDDKNYLNQDFTNDKNKLIRAINQLHPQGGTNYNAGLINDPSGGLIISKTAKNKKIIIFLTDGQAPIPNTAGIIAEANKQNCNIYCITLGMTAPDPLIEISKQTGGICYENVPNEESAKAIYQKILLIAQNLNPCELTWESSVTCNSGYTAVELKYDTIKAISDYPVLPNSIASITLNPNYIGFNNVVPGTYRDTSISISANNSDFNITGINLKYGSTEFTIVNPNLPIFIPKNTSKKITLRFQPQDSSIAYSGFNIQTDLCEANFSAYGGFPSKKIKKPTLQLINPNGGELYAVGSDTIIKWKGISESDTVRLDYSIDNGKTWNLITKDATGLSYKWKNIPKTPSNKCLISIKQYLGNRSADTIPKIQWQQSYGGELVDQASKILSTSDGGYIIVGTTNSEKGDITKNKNENDIWLLKIDSKGNKEWDKSYGGSGNDYASDIKICSDGGYVIAGFTYSKDGNVSNNKGNDDFWIIKIFIDGNIDWERTYGGGLFDAAYSIEQTLDGGFIVIGESNSMDKDISNKKNGNRQDYWIVRLTPRGDILWNKSYGGSGIDIPKVVHQTDDGGYIIGGNSDSKDGEVKDNKGVNDFWIIKLDKDGNIQWSKSYGGSNTELLADLIITKDGGYLLSGKSNSSDGDVINFARTSASYWIVKIDNLGLIQWEKSIGVNENESANSLIETDDNGFIVAGTIQNNYGGYLYPDISLDYGIFRLSQTGKIEWYRNFGGSRIDDASSIIQTVDGGLIVAGSSYSDDRDLTKNQGLNDFWVVKLSPVGVLLQQDVSDSLFSIVPQTLVSNDIDMQKCLVGSNKDSLVTNYILNDGKLAFRTDSIFFNGVDATSFQIVSGFPRFTTDPKQSSDVEFRFTPNRVGIHSAQIIIITQSDTIIQNIKGEGIQPEIEIVNKIIDFGQVHLNFIQDTLAATIKNNWTTPLKIINTLNAGPNNIDFIILTTESSFTLQPGETKMIKLRFKASNIGRTSGELKFEYDGFGSPASILLFAEGIEKDTSAIPIIEIGTKSANASEIISIPIYLKNPKNLSLTGVSSINLELSFNKTLLSPRSLKNKIIKGDSLILRIDSLPIIPNAKNEISTIKFLSALGDAQETVLNIRSIKLNGGQTDVDFENGSFKLLGVCIEGGTRLIKGDGKSTIIAISPNPASDLIKLNYSNDEYGKSEIILTNLLGQKVFTKELELTKDGKFDIELNTIPTGQYYIIIKTETITETKLISIIK